MRYKFLLLVVGFIVVVGVHQAKAQQFPTIRVDDLVSCDTIDTDADGVMTCGSDDGGAGGYATYIEEGDAAKVDGSAADVYVDFDATDFEVVVVGNEANVTIPDDGHNHTTASVSGLVEADIGDLVHTATSDSTWTNHNSYPAACAAGSYATAIGDTLTCSDVWTEAENTAASYIACAGVPACETDAAHDTCAEVADCVPNAWDALTDMVLTDTYIYVGNASNDPVGVVISGEATISNLGAVTLANDALDDQYYDSEGDLTTLLDDNYAPIAHVSSTGADHSYIDQSVATAASPTFTAVTAPQITGTYLDLGGSTPGGPSYLEIVGTMTSYSVNHTAAYVNPLYTPSAANTVDYIGIGGYVRVSGNNFGAGSEAIGLQFMPFAGGTVNAPLLQAVGIDTNGYGSVGITSTIASAVGLRVSPYVDFYGSTLTATDLYGINVLDASTVAGTITATNQYGIYVAKPTKATGTGNYQLVLAGSGAGSGVWFNGTGGQRIYSDATDARVTGNWNVSGEMKGTRHSYVLTKSGTGLNGGMFATIGGITTSNTVGVRMIRAGSVVGISLNVTISGYSGGGNLSAYGIIDAVTKITGVVAVSGAGVTGFQTTQARGTGTFTAGKILNVYITEASSFTYDNPIIEIEVVYDS